MNAIDIPLISREQGVVCDENQVIKWPEYMECYQILLSYQVPFHLRRGKTYLTRCLQPPVKRPGFSHLWDGLRK